MKNTAVSSLIISIPVFKLSSLKKIFWILTFFFAISALVFYVFQINTFTKERYLIRDYETKINYLSQKNKILEINFSKANSLGNMGVYVQNQNFEKIENVEYIRVLEGTVAKNQ